MKPLDLPESPDTLNAETDATENNSIPAWKREPAKDDFFFDDTEETGEDPFSEELKKAEKEKKREKVFGKKEKVEKEPELEIKPAKDKPKKASLSFKKPGKEKEDRPIWKDKSTDEYERKILTHRQRVMMCAGFIAILIAATFLYIIIHFRVTNVLVEGNSHYSEKEISDFVLTGTVKDNSILLNRKYHGKQIKDIPFVETMEVEVVEADTIKIRVYEKTLAGCVTYLSNYFYFDREGIVVESASYPTMGVPEITGLHFDSVVLYEPLPVGDDAIFGEILNLTQLLDKYEIVADKIYFDPSKNVTLYFGDARIRLGDNTNIDEKVMQLPEIVPHLTGQKGLLDMSNYSEGTETLTFKSDD